VKNTPDCDSGKFATGFDSSGTIQCPRRPPAARWPAETTPQPPRSPTRSATSAAEQAERQAAKARTPALAAVAVGLDTSADAIEDLLHVRAGASPSLVTPPPFL
jgi:hypothetical protein